MVEEVIQSLPQVWELLRKETLAVLGLAEVLTAVAVEVALVALAALVSLERLVRVELGSNPSFLGLEPSTLAAEVGRITLARLAQAEAAEEPLGQRLVLQALVQRLILVVVLAVLLQHHLATAVAVSSLFVTRLRKG